MGERAARRSEIHQCGEGHMGSLVDEASGDVQTGRLGQARLLDGMDCPGDTANVTGGAATVWVNGLPAARRTSTSSHGGKIGTGFATVLIGGATITVPLKLEGDEAFKREAREAIKRLLTTETGLEIFRKLAERGDNIFLTQGPNQAIGPPARVLWDPYTKPDAMWHPIFSLGHELVHATHGTPASANEERRTAGTAPTLDANGKRVFDAQGRPNGTHIRDNQGNLVPAPDYSNEFPSENSLRRELGYPNRDTYLSPDPNNLYPTGKDY